MQDSRRVRAVKPPQQKPIPDWVITLLSIGTLVVGFIGMSFLTLTLWGEASRDQYASAFVFTLTLGLGALVAAIGVYRLPTSVFSAIAGTLLLILALGNLTSFNNATRYDTFSPSSGDLIMMYLGAIVLTIPLITIGVLEARRRKWKLHYAYFGAYMTILVVFGLAFVLPTQTSLNSEREAFHNELQR